MRVHQTILGSLAALALAADAATGTLQFACAGTESIYTETFEEHQKNLTERPGTVHVEVDLEKKTMSVSGTTNADGKGSLKVTPASFDTFFQRARVIYEVPFKYVQVHLPRARGKFNIIATTHLDLSEPNAEGRLLFIGTCRVSKANE